MELALAIQRLPKPTQDLVVDLFAGTHQENPADYSIEFLEALRIANPEDALMTWLCLQAQAVFAARQCKHEGQVSFVRLLQDLPACFRGGDLTLDGNEAKLIPKPELKLSSFTRIASLADIPGNKIAILGAGGGSDGIQAAALGMLCQKSGKTLVFVGSVRARKTTSQDPRGNVDQDRTVKDHGGETVPGVFRITRESTGSGRFLEHVPAGDVPMYLLVEEESGGVTRQVESLVKELGGVDTLIVVDTGGDMLYRLGQDSGPEQCKATPDQDIRVLRSVPNIPGVQCLAAIVATGIDTPEYAHDVLTQAKARYLELSEQETLFVLALYESHWDFTGKNKTLYGKTPFTWQIALRGQTTGTAILPLPSFVVLDSVRPWNPFVPMQPSMAGIFFIETSDLLRVIAPAIQEQ